MICQVTGQAPPLETVKTNAWIDFLKPVFWHTWGQEENCWGPTKDRTQALPIWNGANVFAVEWNPGVLIWAKWRLKSKCWGQMPMLGSQPCHIHKHSWDQNHILPVIQGITKHSARERVNDEKHRFSPLWEGGGRAFRVSLQNNWHSGPLCSVTFTCYFFQAIRSCQSAGLGGSIRGGRPSSTRGRGQPRRSIERPNLCPRLRFSNMGSWFLTKLGINSF